MTMKYNREKLREQVVADRRYLHANAEFGMELPKTGAYVRSRLEEMGYSVTPCGGGFTASVGQGERCILLRADMDALKIQERNDLPFRTSNGISHVCGHDMHTAILLGAAAVLKENESELKGTVKFMFQPGEEVMEGAKSMIEAGVLETPRVDAAMALHVLPHMEDGLLQYVEGGAASSADRFRIETTGKAGHSSAPELTKDALNALVRIYTAMEGMITREVSMFRHATCTVTHLEAGNLANNVAGSGWMEGTLRCYDTTSRDRLVERMKAIVAAAELMSGCTCTLRLHSCPPLMNDPILCREMALCFQEVEGLRFSAAQMPFSASEDMAYVAERVPTMYLMLGVGERDRYPNHDARAIFSEKHLHHAAYAMAYAAARWLCNKDAAK